MASLYLLIPVALLFVAVAVALWLWANHDGQFEDLESQGQQTMLHEIAEQQRQRQRPRSDD